ncbi:hypothetical protein Esti_004609 [Eimeria stiedai]
MIRVYEETSASKLRCIPSWAGHLPRSLLDQGGPLGLIDSWAPFSSMYLSQWRLWDSLGQHRRTDGASGGPTERLTRRCRGGLPAGPAPTAVARDQPAPSSSDACPEDGDGDLEPPRLPKGVKPGEAGAPGSASHIYRRRSLQAREGPPMLCFWVYHMKAHDLGEVGRGLWSAAVAMGRFLVEHSHILGAPPLRGPFPMPQGSDNNEGAPLSFTCNTKVPDAAPERDFSLEGPSVALGKACKTYRVLELGSGVGFLGPVLKRLLRGVSQGAPGAPPKTNACLEIYLTDVDAGALQLCQLTQRLDEAMLGDPHEGPPEKIEPSAGSNPLQVEGPQELSVISSAAEGKAEESAAEASQQGPPVNVRVRRLDWRHGGPWTSALRARGSATSQGPPALSKDLGASSAAGRGPSQRASRDPFEWLPEEIEAVQAEGAIDLVVACDVLYDFDLNEALANLLQALLKRNPKSRCLLAHTRRLGIVCPTSSVPVDVFAEDFWDRFCDPDPQGEPQQSEEASAALFEVYVHSKPMPTSLMFSGVSAPGEAERVSRWLSEGSDSFVGAPGWAPPKTAGNGGPLLKGPPRGDFREGWRGRLTMGLQECFLFVSCVSLLLMAIRAPSQELYSALFSGEAMKEALQWDDSIQGSGPNDSWRTESRDEYRGHHWVARSPCWAPTSAREPHRGLGRRRNEALLQRVGGGYQLYGPISWASFKKVDAQTNTPIDAARHAATQTAAEAALAAAATAGGATQAAAPAAAAAGERHTPKRKEARWYPRQQRCVAGGSSVPGRVKVPSASLEGPSSCCCCCCCCSGSQDTEAHVAAAGSKRYCLPFTAGPATATTAAASAAAAEGMPTVTLEPRENIRAATASAHRCRSTIRRGSRLQQQQQQQHQQQQEMLQGFCGCSCRKTSRGPLFASSKFPGGAQGSSLFEAAEAGPQTGLSGGPPSVLQGYAGLLPEFPRGPAMQSQQAEGCWLREVRPRCPLGSLHSSEFKAKGFPLAISGLVHGGPLKGGSRRPP